MLAATGVVEEAGRTAVATGELGNFAAGPVALDSPSAGFAGKLAAAGLDSGPGSR